jgi:fido (protein-threonine AMPylation protein)
VTGDDPYVYPGTSTLRNALGIIDSAKLNRVERRLVVQRMRHGVRTQAQYLKQLAAQAGHELDLTRIDPVTWIEASKASHGADYSPMVDVIRQAISGKSYS